MTQIAVAFQNLYSDYSHLTTYTTRQSSSIALRYRAETWATATDKR
jgi:hypothetical protein